MLLQELACLGITEMAIGGTTKGLASTIRSKRFCPFGAETDVREVDQMQGFKVRYFTFRNIARITSAAVGLAPLALVWAGCGQIATEADGGVDASPTCASTLQFQQPVAISELNLDVVNIGMRLTTNELTAVFGS